MNNELEHERMPAGERRGFAEDETGDVPGWVLITLMTAGLVVTVWMLAGPALSGLFERAIASVGVI